MTELDRAQLRVVVIRILEAYCKDSRDERMRQDAQHVHNVFADASPVLPAPLSEAVHLLVWIGYDLPGPPKPSRKQIQKLIEKLKKETRSV